VSTAIRAVEKDRQLHHRLVRDGGVFIPPSMAIRMDEGIGIFENDRIHYGIARQGQKCFLIFAGIPCSELQLQQGTCNWRRLAERLQRLQAGAWGLLEDQPAPPTAEGRFEARAVQLQQEKEDMQKAHKEKIKQLHNAGKQWHQALKRKNTDIQDCNERMEEELRAVRQRLKDQAPDALRRELAAAQGKLAAMQGAGTSSAEAQEKIERLEAENKELKEDLKFYSSPACADTEAGLEVLWQHIAKGGWGVVMGLTGCCRKLASHPQRTAFIHAAHRELWQQAQ
jgi:hypothetical protein